MKPNNINWPQIKLLILDSDGVLTDGGVYYFEDGTEFRRFNIKDGYGLRALMDADIEVAIISRSPSLPVQQRAKQLGIKHVFLGAKDKLTTAQELTKALNLTLQQTAFIGDDIPDLTLLENVGFPITVADAVEAVKEKTVYVTVKPGGHGAVREVCDLILKANH